MNHALPQSDAITTERTAPPTPERGLVINEIFFSVQGESTRAGEPCVFVRLRGCHLRCAYCDTEYAFHEGAPQTQDAVLAEVARLGGPCRLVQVTGGEPLLQPRVHPLMTALCDAGYTVLIETSGACDIRPCDPRVIRVMDLKTPGSGMADKNRWENIPQLNARDEVKFVLTDRADYDWMKDILTKLQIRERVAAVLVSAAAPMAATDEIAGTSGLSITDLAEWMLEDHLDVRLQTQLHKHIWHPLARGV